MPNGETTTTNENQTPSPEDYQALKAELEAERAKADQLVAEAKKPLQDKVTSLEAQIETKTADIEALKAESEGAKAAYAYAVDDFKKLAAASNPLFPPEAIYGTTIEDIKASAERANALVEKVRTHLQSQPAAAQVPAGAPARSGPETSSLSTAEKINLGLERAKRKKES